MWEIRTITPDELDLFRRRLSRGFGEDPETDGDERFTAVVESDRMFGVFEGSDIVGTGGAFSLRVTVPGGATVPMGGTTMVTVQPTHRRRGILRQLMSKHLDEVAERGEPIAGLWASESGIYGRFGYGPAVFRHQVEVDAGKVAILEPSRAEPSGTVHLIEAEEAQDTLPDVFEETRLQRPGMFARQDRWWDSRVLADPVSRRRGRSAHRFLIHEADGHVDGYAIFRQRPKWEDFVADGEVELVEVVAGDAAAHRALWTFLVNVDLFPRVSWWNAPVDDPLSLIVNDSRRVRRTLSDSLWVRLLDIPTALEARAYEHDAVVVMQVHDPTRGDSPATFRLESRSGECVCERTDASPGLELDVDVLGHLYLGGGDAVAMAKAGRIEGDAPTITQLHRLFHTDSAPWCPEIF